MIGGLVAALALSVGSGAASAAEGSRLLVGIDDVAAAGRLTAAITPLGAQVRETVADLRMVRVDVRPGAAARVGARLRALPFVQYVEPDRTVFRLASEPRDPRYAAGDQWNLERIGAADAWDLLPQGASTLVAVIDSGLDATHPEFTGRIQYSRCTQPSICATQPIEAMIRDSHLHGTHVSGIIGANTNNGVGIASASGGRVTLLPIGAFNSRGVADDGTVLSALVYAINSGAKVVNMSFGATCGTKMNQAWRDAVDLADARGVLLVVAAGNEGYCENGSYPENDPRVISVAATDRMDNIAKWNGYGQSNTGTWVTVAAPGLGILSTVPMVYNGGYATLSGTSMAAPHVSAQAALLFQVPGATKQSVMNWIKSTCDPAITLTQCGGRINIYRSVHLATRGIDPGPGRVRTEQAAAPSTAAGATVAAAAPARPAPPADGPPARTTATDSAPVTGASPSPTATPTAATALVGTAANVTWTGRYWASAPAVAVGICAEASAALGGAFDAALTRWADAASRGLNWRVAADGRACDAEATAPRVLLTIAGDGAAAATAVTVSGAGCEGAAACWVETVTVAVNPQILGGMAEDQRAAELMRALARAVGLGEARSCADASLMLPASCAGRGADLGADDIASLNALLATTQQALQS
ncbi:MAG: S8 family serine peptidase [Dehalococcoidia bacterium]